MEDTQILNLACFEIIVIKHHLFIMIDETYVRDIYYVLSLW